MKSVLILFDNIVSIYIWILIINAIISWLVAFNVLNTSNRFVYSVLDVSYRLTAPPLNYIRRFLPNLGSIDISPVVLILALMFLRNLVFEMLSPRVILIMIIDGKKEAANLREEIKNEILEIKKKTIKIPV